MVKVSERHICGINYPRFQEFADCTPGFFFCACTLCARVAGSICPYTSHAKGYMTVHSRSAGLLRSSLWSLVPLSVSLQLCSGLTPTTLQRGVPGASGAAGPSTHSGAVNAASKAQMSHGEHPSVNNVGRDSYEPWEQAECKHSFRSTVSLNMKQR